MAMSNTATRPTASDLANFLAAGRTVYIVNSMRAWKITPKTAAAFAKAGMSMFKDGAKGELLMASGRRYVDASYCRVEVR